MAKKRETIKMKSSESSEIYSTQKNPKNKAGRMELKKYDKTLRKHVIFKEAK
jgi:large subunit ribosomal protein L33